MKDEQLRVNVKTNAKERQTPKQGERQSGDIQAVCHDNKRKRANMSNKEIGEELSEVKSIESSIRKLAGRTPEFLDHDKYNYFSVIMPVLADTGDLLFEVRSDGLKNQPGEICFPGGLIEAGETPQVAGVREMCEELLVSPDDIEIIAPLDILVTNHRAMVHPYVAYLRGYNGAFNHDEVKEVFTVPFLHFQKHDPIAHDTEISVIPCQGFPFDLIGGEDYPWRCAKHTVLFYLYKDKTIWGLTAQIIQNIVKLCRNGE